MMQKFCIYQSDESYEPPRCTYYKDPELGYYKCPFYCNEPRAKVICKSFKKLAKSITIEERVDTLERMITRLDRKLTHYIDTEILCRNPNKED